MDARWFHGHGQHDAASGITLKQPAFGLHTCRPDGSCIFSVTEVVKTFDLCRVPPETLDEFRYEMLHSGPF